MYLCHVCEASVSLQEQGEELSQKSSSTNLTSQRNNLKSKSLLKSTHRNSYKDEYRVKDSTISTKRLTYIESGDLSVASQERIKLKTETCI